MTRGGSRPGAGRPLGATDPRLTPEATRVALDALRLPGESWAALGRRIGVGRSAVGQALVRGLSVRRLEQWTIAASSGASSGARGRPPQRSACNRQYE